jgi:hypothetical protein
MKVGRAKRCRRLEEITTMNRLLPPTLLLVALGLLGCSSTKGEGYVNPNFELSRIGRVAVVDGNNPAFKPQTRQTLLDSFQLEFMKRGWNVIERANIQNALDEMDFQGTDITSQANVKKIGSVLNVDAIVVVNIGTAGDDLSIMAKMVEVETGELAWMGSGEGSVNEGLSTAAGVLGGAIVGAAIGHNTGDHAGTGAVVGGIAGGAVGNSLAPSQMENAKKVVSVVCESLPRR